MFFSCGQSAESEKGKPETQIENKPRLLKVLHKFSRDESQASSQDVPCKNNMEVTLRRRIVLDKKNREVV